VTSARPPVLSAAEMFDQLFLRRTRCAGIRANHNTRLALSEDETGRLKWVAVLTLAMIGQISLAIVHLEKIRPQIAAMTIYTMGLIFVIGLLAAHEVPFVPPTVISSDLIAHVLDLMRGQVGGRVP
jgi:hypothetical protein